MVIVDAAGTIRFVNRQVCVLFGCSEMELSGTRIEMLMPERFRSQHIAHREQYVNNMRARPMGQGLQLYGLRPDGTEFPVEISLSPIWVHDEMLVAASIRDATVRTRVEAELLAARAAAEQARAAADRANQAKSRFLATASHDLRQPLQTLALLNGMLRRTVTNADAAEALEQQEQAIGAMSRLLHALLDISKLESGAVEPDPTDFSVSALFAELRHEFAGVAARKGLELLIEETPVCAHSDPALIGQVVRNLVSNAIKYTRRGRVCLRCPPAHDSSVCIEVRDTGIGIAADQLGHIYDEFFQVGGVGNSSRDGYGLGLSIVQRIVALLDLRLEVHSEVGTGTSFSVLVPRANGYITAAQAGTATRIARGAQSGVFRVLLVEDDASVRDATRLLLTVEGYRVTAVASLEEAVQAARNSDGVDLMLTDYHLRDGETGVDVIRAVRDTCGFALKAVLMTGDTSSAIRELPKDPHLRTATKPVHAEELLTLMRQFLSADYTEAPPT